MEEYIEEPIRVYVETNAEGYITKVFSSDFEQPKETSIFIDSGFGDRFRHAQNQYFDTPLLDEKGNYVIKYSAKDDKNVENSAENN